MNLDRSPTTEDPREKIISLSPKDFEHRRFIVSKLFFFHPLDFSRLLAVGSNQRAVKSGKGSFFCSFFVFRPAASRSKCAQSATRRGQPVAHSRGYTVYIRIYISIYICTSEKSRWPRDCETVEYFPPGFPFSRENFFLSRSFGESSTNSSISQLFPFQSRA